MADDSGIVGRESVRNDLGFKTVLSDSVVNLASKIFANVLYLIFISVAVKYLGDGKYGEFITFIMVVRFAHTFFCSWLLQPAIVKFGREELLESRRINRTISSHLVISLPLVGLAILMSFLFKRQILSYLGLGDPFIYLIVIFIVLNYLAELIYYLLQAVGEIKLMSAIQTVEKAVPLALVVALYFLDITKVSYLVVAFLLGYAAAILVAVTRIGWKMVRPFTVDGAVVASFWKYSLPTFFSAVVGYALTWIDIGIIKETMSLVAVGRFSYCTQIYTGLNQITLVMMTIMTPLAITLITKKRSDLSEKILSEMVPLGMVLFAAFSNLAMMIFHPVLTHLFSVDAFDARFSLAVLLFCLPINFFVAMIGCYITGFGHDLNWGRTINMSFGLVIKILLSLALIARLGMIGGAIATFVYIFIYTLLNCLLLKRRVDYRMTKSVLFMLLVCFLLIVLYIVRNVYVCFTLNFVLMIGFARLAGVFSGDNARLLGQMNFPPPVVKFLDRLVVYFR